MDASSNPGRVAPAPTVTVFTPSYNRAHSLGRVFRSLEAQTYRDFEWLIVDDGSTDGTHALVARLQSSSTFPIRYVRQPHGHKKVASNRAAREARGTFVLPLDSDDELLPDALAALMKAWNAIPPGERDGFSGVSGLCVGVDGKVFGSRFPCDPLDSDSIELSYLYRVSGDKCGFQRTDVLRAFPFDEDCAGLVPESLVWFRIARHYRTRYINVPLLVYHLGEGITARLDDVGARAAGRVRVAADTLNHDWRWVARSPLSLLREAVAHAYFSRYRTGAPEAADLITGIVPRILVAVASPVAGLLLLRDRWARRHAAVSGNTMREGDAHRSA